MKYPDDTQIQTTYLEEIDALFFKFTFPDELISSKKVWHYFDCQKILSGKNEIISLYLQTIPSQLPIAKYMNFINIDNKDCMISEFCFEENTRNHYFYNKSEEKQKDSKRPIIPKYQTEIKIEELKHRRVEQNMIDHVLYPVKLISYLAIDEGTENSQQVVKKEDFDKDQSLRYETFAYDTGFLRILI